MFKPRYKLRRLAYQQYIDTRECGADGNMMSGMNKLSGSLVSLVGRWWRGVHRKCPEEWETRETNVSISRTTPTPPFASAAECLGSGQHRDVRHVVPICNSLSFHNDPRPRPH